MNIKSTVAVIIPTYNRSAMLREAIDSVLAQSYPAHQIIVVNDGSVDDTLAAVASYGDKITCFSKTNEGKSKAMNLGLAHCQSDAVLICDDDDLLPPDALARLVEVLDANPEAGFVYGDYVDFRHNDPQRILLKHKSYKRQDEPSVLLLFLEGMFTSLNTCLVRYDLYKEVGAFREDLIRSQDYDMAIRLARKAKAVYVPHVVYCVRLHEGLRGNSTVSFSAGESKKKWLEYDKIILRKFRSLMDIEEFTPTFAKHWKSGLVRRAALLERGNIMLRRGLWHEAIQDLQKACEISTVPPEENELALFNNPAAGFDLSLDEILSDVAAIRTIHKNCQNYPYFNAIILNVFGFLPWHIKQCVRKGQIKSALIKLRLMTKIFGYRNTIYRLLKAAIK